MRAPYEPSLNRFCECVCEVLKADELYTINEARLKCGMSYRAVENYLTNGIMPEVNLSLAKKCGKAIKQVEVKRIHGGFQVLTQPGHEEQRNLLRQELVSSAPAHSLSSIQNAVNRLNHYRM